MQLPQSILSELALNRWPKWSADDAETILETLLLRHEQNRAATNARPRLEIWAELEGTRGVIATVLSGARSTVCVNWAN